MNDSKQNSAEEGVSLVIRHLKLDGSTTQDKIRSAIAALKEIPGVDGVSYDEITGVFNVAYDARRVCVDTIEDVLKKYSIVVSHDWWTHFKEEYYRFADQNIKDNFEHRPYGCCSKVPRK